MKIVYFLLVLSAVAFTSCDNLKEEPEVNHGYKTTLRMPDPEDLTEEDLAEIQELQNEFDRNAK